MRHGALLAALLVMAGCDDPPAGGDAGGGVDAGALDAGGADAGPAPGTDAGDRDGGGIDAGSPADAGGRDGGPTSLTLPPANGGLDYQLGEAYPPPSGVVVVSRDRNMSPAPGLYTICYVNGFQTQPDERAFWETDHPDLLLNSSQPPSSAGARRSALRADVA